MEAEAYYMTYNKQIHLSFWKLCKDCCQSSTKYDFLDLKQKRCGI